MPDNQTFAAFQDAFGQPPAVVARVPGRINLMGRHVDHQGGNLNLLTIDRHLVVAANRSGTNIFRLRSDDPARYQDFEFRLSDIPFEPQKNWKQQVTGPRLAAWREEIPLWARYPVGAVLRLWHELGDKVPAMELMVHGNLPPAAGLSSSSALTLGSVLCANEIHGWRMSRERIIEVTGEAEWLTGLIGGACAPAAMMTGSPGRLVQVGFFPFQITGNFPFPGNLRIVLANSHDPAVKGLDARNEYNWRVATYRLALVLLRIGRPKWFGPVQHLRDVRPELLGASKSEIYRAMKELPIRITRAELETRHPEQAEDMEPVMVGHTEPDGGYPVRDILMYGLAEMARSLHLGELLEAGDILQVGNWISRSHDGDRVSSISNGTRTAWRPPALTDSYLEELATRAEQGDPQADFTRQCGSYAASTLHVDEMVDLCSDVDGCIGAQIIGAGFGGSMIALVREDAADRVVERLKTAYYEPYNLQPDAWTLVPGQRAEVRAVYS